MSIFALLPAVRDRIRDQCGLSREECRIMPGPKPPPVAGERFVAVHALEWVPGDPDLNRGLDEYFGVSATATIRTAEFQFDDQGEEAYIAAGIGIEALIRSINSAIHQSIDVMVAANRLIANDNDKIIEYLRWSGADAEPTQVSSEWFSGGTLSTFSGKGTDIAGLAMQTNFTRARRVQSFANIR